MNFRKYHNNMVHSLPYFHEKNDESIFVRTEACDRVSYRLFVQCCQAQVLP